VILCDCPGLVFPNFASTKAELVCNGVLPIDQLREWSGPAGLLAQRIPKEVFEQVYSFKVYSKSDSPEMGQEGVTGEELLISFAGIFFLDALMKWLEDSRRLVIREIQMMREPQGYCLRIS
jgi:ribosome biogenesis GTPase A